MSKRLYSQREGNTDEGDSRAAIPLSKATPDLVNGIPVTGEDYLLVVRRQAKTFAGTIVAERPKETKKINLPAHFQMFNSDISDKEDQAPEVWREGFIKAFKSYQKFMQNKKTGSNVHKEIKTMESGHELLYSERPEMTEILPTLSQHSILNLLKYHITWLTKDKEIELQCKWIFGFLVFLDPVLTSKNISILRELSRECIKLRTAQPEHRIPLNIIITIISGAFGQADLL